jgi:DNA (cytosine-5)-methyltransferase 1
MNYVEVINTQLSIPGTFKYAALDLFAGCGGLSLGFEACGILTTGYEMEADYAETYTRNLAGTCNCVKLERGYEYPEAAIVIGGPPCQPFSVGGKQLGLADSRDGFPVFVDAVERVNPDIWLFENVRGLMYRNKWYLDEVVERLKALDYVVEFKLFNAVDFGVPQNRERLIVVGHRGDFQFPLGGAPRVTVGEALGEMAFSIPDDAKFLTPSMDKYVAKYEKASKCVTPRDLHLDRPSRTLTCRNLAGATGDMHRVRLPDGRRRRVTVREAARLQSFPDWFEFCGTETSQFYQVGNAVPPLFSMKLAQSVLSYLESNRRYCSTEIVHRNLPLQPELFVIEEEKEEYDMPEFLPNSGKPPQMKKVINEAIFLLSALGVPLDGLTERRLERMGMAFLAVVDVSQSAGWSLAKQSGDGWAPQTRQIIEYINSHFGEAMSSGSYDDIRRKDLRLVTTAGIVERSANNPDAATNNPTRGYALSPRYAYVVRSFGRDGWDEDVDELLAESGSLGTRLSGVRDLERVSVKLPGGKKLAFTPGEHNRLQKAVIEEFLPRYGHGAEVLYVGDTANKFLLHQKERLAELALRELSHEELPDIIAYSSERDWLFLIEAVHSSGPIDSIRLLQLRELAGTCAAEPVYVTAFLDRATFRKFAPEIAWETEVW